MRIHHCLSVAGVIFALGATAVAQRDITRVQPPQSAVKFLQPWRPAGVGGETQIVGTVIDIRQTPVAKTKVRLRNLNTGAVEQLVETNELGEYTFEIVEPGTYVVEMVMADGRIVGLSNAGSLARYETLQTVVQLPGRWDLATQNVVAAQNLANFGGLSSALTMTAGTLALAVDQNITPVDAGESVSP